MKRKLSKKKKKMKRNEKLRQVTKNEDSVFLGTSAEVANCAKTMLLPINNL